MKIDSTLPEPEVNPDPCRFCAPPDADRIILTSQNFYVMLSLGPMVEGYALVIARHHVECCAAIPSSQLDEFTTVVCAVQHAQHLVYGSSRYYEHGRTGSCLPNAEGERHCHHAHLHCVPLPLDVFSAVARDYPIVGLPSWEAVLGKYKAAPEPYLLVEKEALPAMAVVPQKIPRQYLRTVVAKAIGEPHLADWAAFQGWDLIKAARVRLAPVLQQVARELCVLTL
jgi:diadenosine tetraphosphate (Ap4A) HIT family hydrolase